MHLFSAAVLCQDDRDGPVNLHYRLLVHMKKAGSVIGKVGPEAGS